MKQFLPEGPPCRLMSSESADVAKLRFPRFGSFKFDGIRGARQYGGMLSRTLILLPNLQMQAQLADERFMGLDGELIAGRPYGPDVMQRSQSAVMSEHSLSPIDFYVFDSLACAKLPYLDRYEQLRERAPAFQGTPIQVVEQTWLKDLEELFAFEERAILFGYEGIMLRDPYAAYKHGKASNVGQQLLKLKRFEDAEAIIIGFEELCRNTNEAVIDPRGLTKRSSHKANRVPAGLLGAFIVRDLLTGKEFRLSGKMTVDQRRLYWENRDQLLGRYVTYKHFAVTGVKELPRLPIFKCFRDRRDFYLPGEE